MNLLKLIVFYLVVQSVASSEDGQVRGFFARDETLCTKTLSSRTVVESTVFQTCGYVPEEGVPACDDGSKPFQRMGKYLRLPVKPTRRAEVEPTLVHSQPPGGATIDSSMDPSIGRGVVMSTLMSLPRFFSSLIYGCVTTTITRLSTVFSVVTEQISSAYTCIYPDLVLALPKFRDGDCDEVRICAQTTVTRTRYSTVTNRVACGYPAADVVPVCGNQRRSSFQDLFLENKHGDDDLGSVNDLFSMKRTPPLRLKSRINYTTVWLKGRNLRRNPRYVCLTSTVTATSTIYSTTMSTLSSRYSCYDTQELKFSPAYPRSDCYSLSICSSTTTKTQTVSVLELQRLTCGTIPAGSLPACPSMKRSEIRPSQVLMRILTTERVEEPLVRQLPEVESSLIEEYFDLDRPLLSSDCVTWLLTVTSLKSVRQVLKSTVSSAYSCRHETSSLSPVYDQGFCHLSEAVLDPKCTIVRGTSSGTFTSPGYSNSYSDELDACWIIVAPPESSLITLMFTDFDVESPLKTTVASTAAGLCPFDVVMISTNISAVLSESTFYACGQGTIVPDTFTSTTGYLYVRMITDAGNSHPLRGFSADFLIS